MPRAPRLAARRALGVAIALGMFWLLFWAVRFSGFADPVLALVQPHLDQLGSLIDDPLGIDWGAQLAGWATLLIPSIGILLFLFDAHR